MQLQPEGATRFAGYFRIVNDGAVRLEVVQASGTVADFARPISRERRDPRGVSRDRQPALRLPLFRRRFRAAHPGRPDSAGSLAVSEVLAYHLGENELAVDAEIELDIREAPLRELLLHVPKGYAIAQLNAVGLERLFPERTGRRAPAPNCGWSMASRFPTGR